MPSHCHQQLVLWLARKMTSDGVIVAGFDGTAAQAGMWNDLPRPFTVNQLRPDVWGIARRAGGLVLGEAKTAPDLATAHTRQQLRTFGRLKHQGRGEYATLYLAVPRSAAYALDRTLTHAGLAGERHILCMHIPDCLIGHVEG